MDDAHFRTWLETGQIILVGDQMALWPPPRGAYDPCRAQRWDLCTICPWECCSGGETPTQGLWQLELF